MRADSDIDVLVVRPDHVEADDPTWADQLMHLSEAGRAWTGNDIRILELSETETRSAVAAGEPVIDDVAKYG